MAISPEEMRQKQIQYGKDRQLVIKHLARMSGKGIKFVEHELEDVNSPMSKYVEKVLQSRVALKYYRNMEKD